MFEKFFSKIRKFANKVDDSSEEEISQRCPACGCEIEGQINQKSLTCPNCGSSIANESYQSSESYFSHGAFNRDDEDEEYDEDNLSSDNIDDLHVASTFSSDYVYAYIEKNGMFYNGEIPGISFSKVTLCDSYDECLQQLIENYKEEKEKAYYQSPYQDLGDIQKKHPKARIVKLY